jgi:hypothetical protein
MKADGRFDGHVVQGHVDGVGACARCAGSASRPSSRSSRHPASSVYLVEKGSVAVDGISLTVWGIGGGAFSVALIPFTLEVTNLRNVEAGRLVNLEADVIAKYVERQLSARGRRRKSVEHAVEDHRGHRGLPRREDGGRRRRRGPRERGRLTIAAEKVTPEAINFMARYGAA